MLYEGKAFDSSVLPKPLDGVPAPMLGREAKYGLGVILRPTTLGMTYGHSGFFPGWQRFAIGLIGKWLLQFR